VTILEEVLRLLHPLLPFITEEIYQKLPLKTAETCACASFPLYTQERSYPEEVAAYAVLQEIVRGVRTLRSEFTIPPDKKIRVAIKAGQGLAAAGFLCGNTALLRFLMGAGEVSLEAPAEKDYLAIVGTGFEAFVFIRDVIDVPREIERLKKEIRKAEEYSGQTAKKLESEGFLAKARPEIVAEQRAKKEETDRRIAKMKEYLAGLA
jgi:valyl-tRNA synthetase